VRKPYWAACVAAALVGAAVAAVSAQTPEEEHVSLIAMKFDFLPDEVKVKKGKPVVLDVSTIDRIHGFAIPELKMRFDVVPGQTTHVRVVPEKPGRFTFRCDNFCCDGHEEMEGAIVVEE
jgi:cytochrome c oxidase subunit II